MRFQVLNAAAFDAGEGTSERVPAAGIFVLVAVINHACDPNVQVTPRGLRSEMADYISLINDGCPEIHEFPLVSINAVDQNSWKIGPVHQVRRTLHNRYFAPRNDLQ